MLVCLPEAFLSFRVYLTSGRGEQGIIGGSGFYHLLYSQALGLLMNWISIS
jgi:hypothetical protein